MQRSEWDFDNSIEDGKDKDNFAWPGSPEERVDQFGVRTALVLLCAAFFIAAMWLVTRPSFEKCSALDNETERAACFDTLRHDLFKPPAKGPDIPKG
jgi:hypothetical protein